MGLYGGYLGLYRVFTGRHIVLYGVTWGYIGFIYRDIQGYMWV